MGPEGHSGSKGDKGQSGNTTSSMAIYNTEEELKSSINKASIYIYDLKPNEFIRK